MPLAVPSTERPAALDVVPETSRRQSQSQPGYAYTSRNNAQDSDNDGDLGDNLAFIGDVNSDGFGDYIATVPRADTSSADAGAAYLVFGKKAGLVSFDLKDFTATDGVRFKGSEISEVLGGTRLGGPYSWYGVTGDVYSPYAHNKPIASLGDINGDGLQDFAIGSPGWGNLISNKAPQI